MTIAALYDLFLQHPSVQTDTRKLQPGDIYFALKGDNFDGNLFATQALEKGAAYAVIDNAAYQAGERTILVPDVLRTLQGLAKHHREQFNIPFIAITGSNGKTTSKELVHAVLSTTYKTYTTAGNLNNHIGIPLTLLNVKPDAEIAVIEMGANHQQEIAGYCTYTLPTHGVITNAGKAHLEGFGGEAGVKKGKGELFDFIRAHNGTVFIMNDYVYLQEMSRGIKEVITYGTQNAGILGTVVTGDTFLNVEMHSGAYTGLIQTKLVGDYNLPNVLLAAAVGAYFKVPAVSIKQALEAYTPSNSRSQLMVKGTTHIIMDAYNANPSSMKLAIENFSRQPETKKVLMLGAMAELGEESLQEHRDIIATISKYNWQEVVLVGGDFLKIEHPYIQFANVTEAKDWYTQQNMDNTSILIKGSRSMQMEKIIA
jgi:UDP-N-acetylmuramoyl-tripeptide--D-alanyl-D-alanine ligase